MWLIRLKLDYFAGVTCGQVEFGPGLNVLYGPNELGKSTIAEAVRAVLLLQATSTKHKPWIQWNSDEAPEVELVFQTKPQRFWRVSKTFDGAKGKATLDESKDGVNFSHLTKGRNVDGEIRKLLKWGIPAPGGSSGVKGLPETFLTAVLLPQQDSVTDIFQQHLGGDYDDTGKQMLTQALQALATDPLFSSVLTEAQAKVDEAFTSKGKRKTSKLSPWKIINDEIKQAEDRVRQSKEDEQNSETVRLRIKALYDLQLEATHEFENAKKAFAAREKQFQHSQVLTAQIEVAEKELARVRGIHDEYKNLTAKHERLGNKVEEITRKGEESNKAVFAVETELKVAQEAIDAANSDQSTEQRHIKQQTLQTEILQLEAKEKQAKDELRKAEHIRELSDKGKSLEASAKDESAQLSKTRDQIKVIEGELKLLAGLEISQRKLEALSRLQKAEEATEAVAQLRSENEKKQTQLDELQEQLTANKNLPSQEQLALMKKLCEDLRLAEARLEVGLSVKITPHSQLDVTITADQKQAREYTLASESETLEADGLLKITLADVADIVIRGGKPDSQKAAIDLSSRWKKEVELVLKAAEVSTLDALESALAATVEATGCASVLRQEIKGNEEKIELKTPAASEITTVQEVVEQLNEQLEEYDVSAMTAHASQFESTAMEDRREKIREKIVEQNNGLTNLRVKVEGLEVQLKARREQSEARLTEIEKAENDLAKPWKQVLVATQKSLDDHHQQRVSLETQLKALKDEGDSKLTDSQKRLDTANKKREDLLKTQQQLGRDRDELLKSENICSGELAACTKSFEQVDFKKAKIKVEDLKASVSQHGVPDQPLTAESVESEKKQLEQKRTAVQEIQTQIHNAEGALSHVGGDIARERYENSSEALRQKQIQESETALDYDAWQLLLRTLRQVENDESAHLGQAIMDPVAERIGELTGGRYEGMQLGPALETQGIVVQGETRNVNRLSVGTREQLSTILRLSLAEQLNSVLLLDDQLAQSDPQRIEWFRKMFRESAKKTQIIVLTCRPADYLLSGEMQVGKEYVDTKDGLVRAVNLELLVER